MVKLSDVARRAGVSTATVSRALNNVGTVNPALVERVRDAARELGYRPNAVARNLRRQRTDVWALVIADVENPFFTALARGVEDKARLHGFSVFLCNTDDDVRKEAEYLRVAAAEHVAGVVLSPTSPSSSVADLTDVGIPVVGVDRHLNDPVDTVLSDSRWGAAAATRHLLEEGWQRPACVTGPGTADTAEERLRGYLDAMQQSRRGRNGRRGCVRHAPYTVDGGRAAAASLLNLRTPPDAFLAANSMMALGILQELRSRGLHPARDVGLVAFDDAPWATLLTPELSVVIQPGYDIGAQAAELLAQRIRDRDLHAESRRVILPTRLVVRDSSRRIQHLVDGADVRARRTVAGMA